MEKKKIDKAMEFKRNVDGLMVIRYIYLVATWHVAWIIEQYH